MLTRRYLLRSLPAAAMLPRAVYTAAAVPTYNLIIGTGTGPVSSSSKGIYVADWSANGELGQLYLAAELDNPTFITLSPDGRQLYAISEINEGRATAFSVSHSGDRMLRLDLLNAQTSQGSGPAHISINIDGGSVFVSNYGSGSLTSYKVEASGALSPPVSHFQYTPVDASPEHRRPHAHEASPSPDGRWLAVNDLGSDRIWIYRIDAATGSVTPANPSFWQGRLKSGPRHLVFHPNGHWVYNANELDSTVNHLLWSSKDGTLETSGAFVSTLPAGWPAGSSSVSEIIVSPDGKFLYVGNRGNETIAKFDIHAGSGKLSLSQLAPHGGKTARDITLDPTGTFLLVACQDSGGIVVMSRDKVTGRLSDPLRTYPIDSPQCLVFTK